MARELGGSQISALLESVPGIANVLRSPVADALVHMIRAGAGLEGFQLEHAKELIQYAERRGLVGSSEAEELLAEVSAVGGRRRGPARSGAKKPGAASRPKPKPRPAAGKAKKPAKGKAKSTGRPVKKTASKGRR
jgi:hypothetical protein